MYEGASKYKKKMDNGDSSRGVYGRLYTALSVIPQLFHRNGSYVSEMGSGTTPDAEKYPVKALNGLVGELIEVDYINQNLPRMVVERLIFSATQDGFYLGTSPEFGDPSLQFHLLSWYQHNHDGKLEAVKRIKHKGQIVYENKSLPFDSNSAQQFWQMRNGEAKKDPDSVDELVNV